VATRVSCRACAAELDFEDPIGRSQRCPKCGSDLRCCLNCRHYDTSSYNDCAEPSAERVLEKDRANFCDYFSAAAARMTTKVAESSDRLLDLDKLFRKS